MSKEQDLEAGSFSSWLKNTRKAQIAESGVDVPCGACNACCRSSYFIHIKPEETETLKQIPAELLFAAPGLPAGNVLMGYDEKGHCPMLVDENCSIYEHRPQTCRSFDCRVFPAAGLEAGEDEKVLISQQTKRWKFSYLTEEDHQHQKAVQAAAAFMEKRGDYFPLDAIPKNTTQLAVMAINVYPVFLNRASKAGGRTNDLKVVQAVMDENQRFEAKRLDLHQGPGSNNPE